MAVREVLPGDYDVLDQRLEKELPLSICVSVFSSGSLFLVLKFKIIMNLKIYFCWNLWRKNTKLWVLFNNDPKFLVCAVKSKISMRNNEFCKATKCEKSTISICNVVVKPSYHLRQHNRIISGTFLKTITIFFHIYSECTFNAHFFFKRNICTYKQYVDNVDTPIPLVPMNSLTSFFLHCVF